MQLRRTATEVLKQLVDMCTQMSNKEFCQILPLLMNNSISKHVRHIIGFFELTVLCTEKGTLDYANRIRNTALENSKKQTIKKLNELISAIEHLHLRQEINFRVSYDIDGNKTVNMPSNIARELVYNIEHAVHHMAIIKIALLQIFPNIKTSENFGVAYSTVKYLKECAQ